jgi:Cu2+-exporting ATPase
LLPIVAAFEVSQQTASNIQTNLQFNIAYNIGAMLLPMGMLMTMGISLNPGIGVALMMLQTGLTLSNTYRFQQQPLQFMPRTLTAVKKVNSREDVLQNQSSSMTLATHPKHNPYAFVLFKSLPVEDNGDIPRISNSVGFTNT